jgi:Protein of unknown function (DUF3182)
MRGVVLVYACRLGGRLDTHQQAMLVIDAQAIARIKGYEFGGLHQDGRSYAGDAYFVPDDTLLADEASRLGIRGPDDLYGGVVPHPFVKTKAITHPLVDGDAERPDGWSEAFAERVRDVVLPGFTAFSARDAKEAARRLLGRSTVRVKQPLGAEGKGQALITTLAELAQLLEAIPADEISRYGLVLEENLHRVTTLSVGRIAIDGLAISYHGTQRRTSDNEGRSVYGGSDLVCVRGGWDALDRTAMAEDVRLGVAQARLYDETTCEYPGFMASRRNYDVGQGIDARGRQRSGVLEASWRVGGATAAELVALAAFMQDPSVQVVEASHVEEFGEHRHAPAGAVVHFQGDDPRAGPMIRYTMLTGARSTPVKLS